MEQSPSLETSKSLTNTEIPTSLWNANDYYFVHGGPPRVHIRNRMTPAHNHPTS